jgi:ESS family glutamate:Na+ symporter
MNFWDSDAWSFILLFAVLLTALLVGNIIKQTIPFMRKSLVPTSVLGGLFLLIVSVIYQLITDELLLNASIFGGNGMDVLEILTYHCLALGFIAMTFRPSSGKRTRQRNREIFNTGVTTVSTYLLQAIVGLTVSFIAALILPSFFPAAGILLPFGYGQGTGQALNYGTIYENDYGFEGGKSFGLSIAALGFLSASIGGVIHLNLLRRKGKVSVSRTDMTALMHSEEIQGSNEIPMDGSMDKLTIQVLFVVVAYVLTYLLMLGLSALVPSMQSTFYGFNFLFGVLMAVLIKQIVKLLKKTKIVKKDYINSFLMKRISGFFFDIMIVAGIGAIRLDIIQQYWSILLIMGLLGAFCTYFYNHFVAKTLFPTYCEEQFLAMYGMLTGTASTGMILLRELDPDYHTPVAENLVFQNFPAIVFGFPMMLLATLAPKSPYLVFGIVVAFFVVMNMILFRSYWVKKIFKKSNKKAE